MKKAISKNDQKTISPNAKKQGDNIYRFPISNHHNNVAYNSTQQLKPNYISHETDSPNKNQLQFRNNKDHRKPEFLKFMSQTTKNTISADDQSDQAIKTGYSNSHDEGHKMSMKQKQLRQTIKSDISEYQKLHDKLNYLQNKITDLSNNIDKRKEEKLQFLENEKRDRIKRLDKRERQSTKPSDNFESGKAQTKVELKKFITQVNHPKQYAACDFNPYSPRHNIYYVSQIVKFYKEEKSLARDHLISSAQFLRIFESKKPPTKQQLGPKMLKLERRYPDRKTIVFDLDETLIHCNESVEVPHDLKIKIKFPTGQLIDAGINIRPHATQLLQVLSKNFEIIVFTASHSCYANVVLDHLDPQNIYIHHRLFRQHCVQTPQGIYVKDLRIINRDLSQILLVDNAAYSYAYQIDNAIPIIPYYEGKNDFELKALQTYAESILFAKDVRQVNKKVFKLHRYCEFDDVDKLVKHLYAEWM